MNINSLYVAEIRVVYKIRYQRVTQEGYRNALKGDVLTNFVKNAIVYNKDGCWYDLYTGKKYETRVNLWSHIGTMYINLEKDLVPLSTVMNFEKQNMSKRKIKTMISKHKSKDSNNE